MAVLAPAKWSAKRHRDVLERGICRHLHGVRVAYILERIAAIKRDSARPLTILDAGCGDGVITRRIRDAFPDDVIEAMDADPLRLARARLECPTIVFRAGDVTALPYASAAFDVVVSHHVVEHVASDGALLRECYRVLAPSGWLILGLPHEGGAMGRLLRTLHRRLYAEGEHVNFYTIADMRTLLRRARFRVEDCAKFGFLFPQYYVHLLLLSNRLTFALGHRISQRVDATADSLIFVARKAA
jgi:SAM-dependent methyltransferase